MSKMESSMSYQTDGGTGEFLLRSSKTFEDYEEKEINGGKFLKELIEKNTGKTIKRVSSIYFDDGKIQAKNFNKRIEGLDNFLVFLVYKKNIFGIFSQHPFKEDRV